MYCISTYNVLTMVVCIRHCFACFLELVCCKCTSSSHHTIFTLRLSFLTYFKHITVLLPAQREFHFHNIGMDGSSHQRTLCVVLGIWLFTVAGSSLAFGPFSTTGCFFTQCSLLIAKILIKWVNNDDISLASVYANSWWGVSILDVLILLSLSGLFVVLVQLYLQYQYNDFTQEDCTAVIWREKNETIASESDEKIITATSGIVNQEKCFEAKLTNNDNEFDCVVHQNGSIYENLPFEQEQERRDSEPDYMFISLDGTTSSGNTNSNRIEASIKMDNEVNLIDFQCQTFNTNEEKRYCGIKNSGNTCYLGATLQALLSSRHFLLYLRRTQISTPQRVLPLHEILLHLAAAIGVTPYVNGSKIGENCVSFIKAANPNSLKDKMDVLTDKFKGFEQRDAHEFLCALIDHLHKESSAVKHILQSVDASAQSILANEKPLNTYSVDDCFHLKVKVHLKCNNCKCSR